MKIFKNDYPVFIKKWLGILGLTDVPIIIRCEESGEHLFEWDDIKFDVEGKAFCISIKYPPQKYSILHELGHLYLAKILNDQRIIINYEPLEDFMDMRVLLNGLVDSFVNYKMCQFDEFYRHFILKYPLNKIRMIKTEYFEEMSFFDILDKYNLVYIEYNYTLRKKDRLQRLNDKRQSLKKMRNEILGKAKENNIKFTYKNFQLLDKKLNYFNQIIDSLTFNKLINFLIEILKSLNFWKETDIKDQICYMFEI